MATVFQPWKLPR